MGFFLLFVVRIADWWKEHMRVYSSRGWNEEKIEVTFPRVRAHSLRICTFCFHNLHQCTLRFLKGKRISLTFSLVVFVRFPDYYWVILAGFTNCVPNTLVSCWYISCYKLICEGCESKKCKISVVRAYVAHACEEFRRWSLSIESRISTLDFDASFFLSSSLLHPNSKWRILRVTCRELNPAEMRIKKNSHVLEKTSEFFQIFSHVFLQKSFVL